MCDNIDKEFLGSEGHFGLTDLQDRKWMIDYVSGPAAGALAYWVYAESAEDSSVWKCTILLKDDYKTVGDLKRDLAPELTWEATKAPKAPLPINVKPDTQLDKELTKALQERYPGEEVVCQNFNNEHYIKFKSGLFGYFGTNGGDFSGQIYKDARACDNGEEALFNVFIVGLKYEPFIDTTYVEAWDKTIINVYLPKDGETLVTYHCGKGTEDDAKYFAEQAINKYEAEEGRR